MVPFLSFLFHSLLDDEDILDHWSSCYYLAHSLNHHDWRTGGSAVSLGLGLIWAEASKYGCLKPNFQL